MEREYKWKLSGADEFDRIVNSDTVAQTVTGQQDFHMQAIYYDTENQLFAQMQGGLRLRKENDASVCCLKLAAKERGACKTREEYEAEAPDIYSGLTALIGAGAPKELCMMAASSTLVELCRTDFVRLSSAHPRALRHLRGRAGVRPRQAEPRRSQHPAVRDGI